MSCPVPHTTRDQTWLAVGAVLGISGYCAIKALTGKSKKPSLDRCKLQYFGIPALGEPIRLLLALSGAADWKDERISFADWSSVKSTTKWGQCPVLTLADSTTLTQTKAICRFAAKFVQLEGAALYPSDPQEAFYVDEMIDVFEDVRAKLVPTFSIKDQTEKEAARAALFAPDGACTVMLLKIESFAGDNFVVCGRVTLADLWIFFFLNFLRCGFWDGLPSSLITPLVAARCPKLAAIANHFAQQPLVKAYYIKAAAGDPTYSCFTAPF